MNVALHFTVHLAGEKRSSTKKCATRKRGFQHQCMDLHMIPPFPKFHVNGAKDTWLVLDLWTRISPPKIDRHLQKSCGPNLD